MNHYIAHITDRRGIARRYALLAWTLDEARREAQLLARALFGKATFCVREA